VGWFEIRGNNNGKGIEDPVILKRGPMALFYIANAFLVGGGMEEIFFRVRLLYNRLRN